MRQREEDCTDRTPPAGGAPPNAFSTAFLDRLAGREPAPATPEADFAGPWRVVRLPGDGAPGRSDLWACYPCGGRRPVLTFEAPDLAYLGAAALAVAERPPRFRLQADAERRVHLIHDGLPVGTAALRGNTLPLDLTRLADLRVRPRALAHLLLSVPDETLRRAGAILVAMGGAAGSGAPGEPAGEVAP